MFDVTKVNQRLRAHLGVTEPCTPHRDFLIEDIVLVQVFLIADNYLRELHEIVQTFDQSITVQPEIYSTWRYFHYRVGKTIRSPLQRELQQVITVVQRQVIGNETIVRNHHIRVCGFWVGPVHEPGIIYSVLVTTGDVFPDSQPWRITIGCAIETIFGFRVDLNTLLGNSSVQSTTTAPIDHFH